MEMRRKRKLKKMGNEKERGIAVIKEEKQNEDENTKEKERKGELK